MTNSGGGTTSVSFLQANGTLQVHYLKGTNDSFFRQITCRTCKMKGHYQTHCPVVNSSGNTHGTETSTSRTDETTESSSKHDTSVNSSLKEVRNLVFHSRILLNQNVNAHLNPNWVLLDSESTDHIFCNSDLLTKVHATTNGEFLKLHTSAGTIDTYKKGFFGSFNVWYNPAFITCSSNGSISCDHGYLHQKYI